MLILESSVIWGRTKLYLEEASDRDDIVSDYPYERHRSIWLLEDFKNHPYLKKQKKVSSKHPSGKMILVFHNLKGTS